MPREFQTITAAELIKLLQELPDDAPVAFSSNYGDHCCTEQVHSLEGSLNEAVLKATAYSVSGFAVNHGDEDGRPDGDSVWIIS